ncbi:MAG: hypothetical protein HRF49_06200 [bacterium]|jgi:MazG family protein
MVSVFDTSKESFDFEDLVEIMRILRSPEGCPWDREQSLATLKDYCLEEAGEVCSAIDKVLETGDPAAWGELCEELGDLLLQVVFQAQLASEENKFAISDVVGAICTKLIRRHPHVFGGTVAETSGEVLANWRIIKAAEREAKAEGMTISAKDAEKLVTGNGPAQN